MTEKQAREYRILEEKYPSYSLWYPQYKEEGSDWIHFTKSGRPHDRLILYSLSEAKYSIKQDIERQEYLLEMPEIIYHEVK